MLTPNDRIAILLHNGLAGSKGKTGISLLRYSQNEIVAVIDEAAAGQSVKALTGVDRQVPVVASVQAALAFNPTVLAIGLAPSGGRLPDPWYAEVKQAVSAGLSVMNGLHTQMNADPEIASQIQPSRWVWDIRQEPEGLEVGSGKARLLECDRILTVGTDMSIGKMSTSIELTRAAMAKGQRAKLVATGQTGLMLGADGIALDAIRVDYAAGAVEQAVIRSAPEQDILFIEGQGSLLNPGSTATLPLMRGSQPTALILVHKAGMTHIQHFPDFEIPSLSQVITLYETAVQAGGTFAKTPVAGIALNTFGLGEKAASDAIEAVSQETGLPCTDVVRFGGISLLDSVFNKS
ncbi:DUF1611 domain-containing protein [cf. Phormidesmis sp. LEGE 11477]|uniref:DUF1611 domain-containing protein n=1 Tax=cf. Phormidesmis sp. LEGE 11477 TaxID=1828680 RepID=UPI001880D67D|nr:DUF1611 domain-containing protein [cf. Phormidesmis sp. LEGE 11477]MBE9061502.1 DUF1611 domain-containing protein [cf. Phormidesmis sp. LEGE 11477]